MRSIYRNALRVPIWIGEENESVSLAIEVIKKLAAIAFKNHGEPVCLQLLDSQLVSLGLPGQKSPHWNALRYFFRRPWFERAWIIQETANAAKLQVICGGRSLTWDDIVYTARCIHHPKSNLFATTETASLCEHIDFITQCRENSQQGIQMPLLELLHRSRRCNATDDRDKIYALYPLSNATSELGLPDPDYHKQAKQIYKETCAVLIRSSHSLNILSCAGAARDSHSHSLDLPSWVPDWNYKDRSTSLGMESGGAYNAGGTLQTPPHFSKDLSNITVEGKFTDCVDAIGDTLLPFHGSLRGENVNAVIRDWPNPTSTLQPGGKQERILDVFPDTNFQAEDTGVSGSKPRSISQFWNNEGQTNPGLFYHPGGRVTESRTLVAKLLYFRRVFRSSVLNVLGLASMSALPGDFVAVICGCKVLLVLWRRDDGHYVLVGESYAHGLMKGEAFCTTSSVAQIHAGLRNIKVGKITIV